MVNMDHLVGNYRMIHNDLFVDPWWSIMIHNDPEFVVIIIPFPQSLSTGKVLDDTSDSVAISVDKFTSWGDCAVATQWINGHPLRKTWIYDDVWHVWAWRPRMRYEIVWMYQVRPGFVSNSSCFRINSYVNLDRKKWSSSHRKWTQRA